MHMDRYAKTGPQRHLPEADRSVFNSLAINTHYISACHCAQTAMQTICIVPDVLEMKREKCLSDIRSGSRQNLF